MATRLDERIRRLRVRKTDAVQGVQTRSARLAKSDTQFDSPADALDYITESMFPVDAKYTKSTFDECKRVENQIAEACRAASVGVSFDHQGSVTSDTHIRLYSDIDLLSITPKYVAIQPPLKPTIPYQGDALADLRELRTITEKRLSTSFPNAKVDTTGMKAVSISGGSLLRKIDVIFAARLITEAYQTTGDNDFRGLDVLDLDGPKRISNLPFLHNRELRLKDEATGGDLKRLIRFAKSAKYDADSRIDVSSYDLASLCYNLPLESFRLAKGSDFELAREFLNFSEHVRNNAPNQSSLRVPNKTRLLFGEQGINVGALKLFNEEILEILLQAANSRRLK